MLKELKFVQGAVAKKDFLPAMTHFAIENGVVRSFNGIVALSSPIPFDIDCKPKATTLVKAISHCNETVTLNMTQSGRLSIRSGPFKAFIECVHQETPHVYPEGDHIDIDGAELLEGLKRLEPFIGTDASRQWGTGVLLRGQSAFATNNVVLVEYWMGAKFPHVVNIPRSAIAEILRVNEPCVSAQMSEKSMTFHFADGRWIRTALLSTEWPDVESLMDKVSDQHPIPEQLFDAIDAIGPFADKLGRMYIKDGFVCTVDSADREDGASYEVPEFKHEGIYRREMLDLLRGVAHTCDFGQYPAPCLFYGDRIRGAIVGMKI